MKKLLTTITLLCFSVAVQAQQYLCIGEKAAYLTSIGNNDLYDTSDTRLVIDFENGYRLLGVPGLEDYTGICAKTGNEEILFECSDQVGITLHKITAYTSNNSTITFTYVRQTGQMVNARLGRQHESPRKLS